MAAIQAARARRDFMVENSNPEMKVARNEDEAEDEEIAEAMECPIGTVRSRIFRAREAIAEKLRPLLGTVEGKRW